MVNEMAVGVLASVIGWKFTVLDVATGLSVAIIGVVKVPLLALFAGHLTTAFVGVGLLFNSLRGVL
jgi:hypothetical protein